MMTTASASQSRYSEYAIRTISGRPFAVSYTTALGSAFMTSSTMLSPKVSLGVRADHRSRQLTSPAFNTERQGPIPEPVAINKILRKSLETWRTPQVGIPRIQISVGGLAITFEVQSPALDTTTEKSLLDPLSSRIEAKECHSSNGSKLIRTKHPGYVVMYRRSLIWIRMACEESTSVLTGSLRRCNHG